MKKILLASTACLLLFIYFACNKSDQKPKPAIQEQVTTVDLETIKKLGFNTQDAIKVNGGFIVEEDIFLSDETVRTFDPNAPVEEQYRTTVIVNATPNRNITVSVTNLPAAYTTALDAAIARYNALSMRLTFTRVANGGNIVVTNANTLPVGNQDRIEATDRQHWGRSGFPTAAGNPWNTVGLNLAFIGNTPNAGFLTTLIAHEMGHCIGFRHTDYLNTAYSCNVGGAEPPEAEGAVQIPGTPAAPDAGSWMLACQGATTNRPFNSNDLCALYNLYGPARAFIQQGACNGIYSTYYLTGNPGDVIVLQLSFGGYIAWNGQSNGTGGTCSLYAGGQSTGAASPHYTSSGGTGFSISCQLTFTMACSYAAINTNAVLNNSTYNSSSAATLQILSVNGVSNTTQQAACYGNSGGSW